MRKTTGYAGRYLFPCPFSAGLFPLFSSVLVTSFPSPPHTVISFFRPISPFRFYSATGVSSRLYQQAFCLSVIVSTAPLCLSAAHFLPHFFSAAPHSSCLHHSLFPFSFLRPCHLFIVSPLLAVISPLPLTLFSAFFPFVFPDGTKNLYLKQKLLLTLKIIRTWKKTIV